VCEEGGGGEGEEERWRKRSRNRTGREERGKVGEGKEDEKLYKCIVILCFLHLSFR
jgi:hypothetical protein